MASTTTNDGKPLTKEWQTKKGGKPATKPTMKALQPATKPSKAKAPKAPKVAKPKAAPKAKAPKVATPKAPTPATTEPAWDEVETAPPADITPAPPVVETPAAPSFPPFELTAAPAIPADAKGELVTAKTICVHVVKGKFGNKRRASTADVTVDADKRLLSLTKTMLDSPELVAIQRLDYEVRDWLASLCLKSMFKGGVSLLPIGLVQEVHEGLQKFAERRALLVDAAVEAYPQRVTETSTRLGVLHNPLDYPDAHQFRAAFKFEWQFITFDTPTRLKAINVAIFQAEQEKAQAKLRVVAEQCEQAMRAGMLDLVDKMVERLSPDTDGKPKRFHASLVENMNDWLRTFEMRNITDDAQLDQIVKRARMVLDGVDAKVLRENDAMRDAIAGQFQQIKDAMAAMVVERGTRAISFEDETE